MTPTDQWSWDIFVTAIEGGINYWAQVDDYDPQNNLRYSALIVWSEDGDTFKKYLVGSRTIKRGMRLAATEWRDEISWSAEKPPLVYTDDTDWDFDAGDADVILQLGVFGEVIFG